VRKWPSIISYFLFEELFEIGNNITKKPQNLFGIWTEIFSTTEPFKVGRYLTLEIAEKNSWRPIVIKLEIRVPRGVLFVLSVTLVTLLLYSWRHERHNKSRHFQAHTLLFATKVLGNLNINLDDPEIVTISFRLLKMWNIKEQWLITSFLLLNECFQRHFYSLTAAVSLHISHWRRSMVIFSLRYLKRACIVCYLSNKKRNITFSVFHNFALKIKQPFKGALSDLFISYLSAIYWIF